MLEKARQSMEAGATGLIFGRNVWQREHDESLRFVAAAPRDPGQVPVQLTLLVWAGPPMITQTACHNRCRQGPMAPGARWHTGKYVCRPGQVPGFAQSAGI